MRFRIALGAFTAATCLVVTTACGGGAKEEPAPAPTPAPNEPLFKPVDPNTIPPPPSTSNPSLSPPAGPAGAGTEPMAMVTDLASGWPVNLRVGQTMTARLTADRAAGGRWSLRAGSDGGIVAVEGEPSYETPPDEAAVEVFRLNATKPGQTTLTFDYKQGSSAQAIRTVSYPVTVQ